MSNIQIMYVAQHGYDDAEGTAELPLPQLRGRSGLLERLLERG